MVVVAPVSRYTYMQLPLFTLIRGRRRGERIVPVRDLDILLGKGQFLILILVLDLSLGRSRGLAALPFLLAVLGFFHRLLGLDLGV